MQIYNLTAGRTFAYTPCFNLCYHPKSILQEVLTTISHVAHFSVTLTVVFYEYPNWTKISPPPLYLYPPRRRKKHFFFFLLPWGLWGSPTGVIQFFWSKFFFNEQKLSRPLAKATSFCFYNSEDRKTSMSCWILNNGDHNWLTTSFRVMKSHLETRRAQ